MCQILTNIHSMDVRRKSNHTVVYPGEVPDSPDESAKGRIDDEVDASLLRDAVQRLPGTIFALIGIVLVAIPSLAR